MLSFNFKLTPAQTNFLIRLACDVREEMVGNVDWPRINGVPDHYVSIAKNLEAKGLAHHDPDRNPALIATPEGKAIAAMIIKDAAQIMAFASGAEERARKHAPKPANRRSRFRVK